MFQRGVEKEIINALSRLVRTTHFHDYIFMSNYSIHHDSSPSCVLHIEDIGRVSPMLELPAPVSVQLWRYPAVLPDRLFPHSVGHFVTSFRSTASPTTPKKTFQNILDKMTDEHAPIDETETETSIQRGNFLLKSVWSFQSSLPLFRLPHTSTLYWTNCNLKVTQNMLAQFIHAIH